MHFARHCVTCAQDSIFVSIYPNLVEPRLVHAILVFIEPAVSYGNPIELSGVKNSVVRKPLLIGQNKGLPGIKIFGMLLEISCDPFIGPGMVVKVIIVEPDNINPVYGIVIPFPTLVVEVAAFHVKQTIRKIVDTA